jgi:hypothetical protein
MRLGGRMELAIDSVKQTRRAVQRLRPSSPEESERRLRGDFTYIPGLKR